MLRFFYFTKNNKNRNRTSAVDIERPFHVDDREERIVVSQGDHGNGMDHKDVAAL